MQKTPRECSRESEYPPEYSQTAHACAAVPLIRRAKFIRNKPATMIGFEEEFAKENVRADEGPDTRSLEKRALYEFIAKDYLLPPFGSRGVTRDYLLRVHRGQVFRIPIMDIKRFEVELQPVQTKKLGVANNGLLTKKLNILLESREEKTLGFDHYEPPEQVQYDHQVWLCRVARYIDATNLTEFFEQPAQPEPRLTNEASHISHIFYGRRKASKYFFQPENTKNNRKLWDSLRSVSDLYRTLQSQSLTIEVFQNAVREAQTKADEMDRRLGDMVSQIALTYVTLQYPHVKADTIVKGNNENHPEVKEAINMACKLYSLFTRIRFIYCSDNVLDWQNVDVLQATKECLALNIPDDFSPPQSQTQPDPPLKRKATGFTMKPGRTSPSKTAMDDETNK